MNRKTAGRLAAVAAALTLAAGLAGCSTSRPLQVIFAETGSGNETTAPITIPGDGDSSYLVWYAFGLYAPGQGDLNAQPPLTFSIDQTDSAGQTSTVVPDDLIVNSGTYINDIIFAGQPHTFQLHISSRIEDGNGGATRAGYWTVKVIYTG